MMAWGAIVPVLIDVLSGVGCSEKLRWMSSGVGKLPVVLSWIEYGPIAGERSSVDAELPMEVVEKTRWPAWKPIPIAGGPDTVRSRGRVDRGRLVMSAGPEASRCRLPKGDGGMEMEAIGPIVACRCRLPVGMEGDEPSPMSERLFEPPPETMGDRIGAGVCSRKGLFGRSPSHSSPGTITPWSTLRLAVVCAGDE
jgi:hypothetical protein